MRKLKKSELKHFSENYNTDRELAALNQRENFIRAYPSDELVDIKLAEYVIGRKDINEIETFCYLVEVGTRSWARITGSTAYKFGIYFGQTKTDTTKMYRFTKKYGDTKMKAFNAVKASLLELIESAQNNDYAAIDCNLLSQMFKAKIISLYFPEKFINICSKDHTLLLAEELKLEANLAVSEYQHLLYDFKLQNPITESWSNTKFMSFLYSKFIRSNLDEVSRKKLKKAVRNHPEVNYPDKNDANDKIGKNSEKFALKWEKERLRELGLTELAGKIEDMTKRPGYGYDFLSFNVDGSKRYIEVKTLRQLPNKEGCSFHLSSNELAKSTSPELKDNYYFYLVSVEKGTEVLPVPVRLDAFLAEEVHQASIKKPTSYVVSMEYE
ncbi:DUF3883 domain-containing protein [Shewanella electrodiphila]|uniref:DUF3883 domain-containing protein n=1 Tax=Shewanella electrodiphila TaxID=934143 RepID=A0ABT0KM60_9GAMM|nr:DUF3883 domain-containing protein [Shewanella electrodiphila]MCL1044926.1 DUF3883 domain-containing protein [Shewanella electrodiphila]